MGEDLARTYSVALETFQFADRFLGFPLSQLMWQGPEVDLNDTINTQPALLVHSIAALRIFQASVPDFKPAFVAGHSMGEISALVASGALEFKDALHLVRRRGELMKMAGEVSPGGMAAILGMSSELLEEICQQSSDAEHLVQIANDNCPGQIVISGDEIALEKAITLARERGAKRAQRLSVSIAAHSHLMAASQDEFAKVVKQAPIKEPLIPILGNVTALPLHSDVQIKADLTAQLTSPVRWRESLLEMKRLGVENYIEIGNGNVLLGLVKRTDPSSTRIPFGDVVSIERFLAEE
jgi:[acyl-carrier-protein] S-malonyltransferase